jgi:hypothetical protein
VVIHHWLLTIRKGESHENGRVRYGTAGEISEVGFLVCSR